MVWREVVKPAFAVQWGLAGQNGRVLVARWFLGGSSVVSASPRGARWFLCRSLRPPVVFLGRFGSFMFEGSAVASIGRIVLLCVPPVSHPSSSSVCKPTAPAIRPRAKKKGPVPGRSGSIVM